MSTAADGTVRAERTAYALPLRRPLVTAAGAIDAVRGYLLRLRDADGQVVGVGEGCPLPGFVSEDAARRHAHDEAELDRAARAAGTSVAALLAGDRRAAARVRTHALIVARDPDEAAREASSAIADGFVAVKLKVAGGPLADDVARVGAVRAAVGDSVTIRLDANGGWDRADALDAVRALAAFGPALVEQPVAATDLVGLARVRAACPFAVAADEAVTDLGAALAILEADAAAVLVLKPMRLGGLRPALAVARVAIARGADVFVTTSLEGAVGRAGAVHLAAAIDGDGGARIHGLATGHLLERDVASGIAVRAGSLALPDAPGLGVSLP